MSIRKIITYVTSDGISFDNKDSAKEYEQNLSKCSKMSIEVVVVMQELYQTTYRSIIDSPESIESLKESLIKKYESKCIQRGDIHYWGIPGPPKVLSVTIKSVDK